MASPNIPTGDAPTTPPATLRTTDNGTGQRNPPAARQRDPPAFSGTGTQDIDDWLAAYERVSKFNAWDDHSKLNNVAFYLTDIAKTWFLNHESEISSWTVFRSRLADLFGRPALRKADAEHQLSQRVQLTDETFTSYIEGILSLCNRADPTMSEPAKIKHILKGIAPDAFHLLVLKSPSTVQDVVALCKDLQEAKNFRLPSFSSSVQPEPSNLEALRALIRQVVKEEIARACPGTQDSSLIPEHTTHSVLALVRQEVSAALGVSAPPSTHSCSYPDVTPPALPQPPLPLPQHPYRTYADVVRTPPTYDASAVRTPGHEAVAPIASMYSQGGPYFPRQRQMPFSQRREARTCFYCGIRGHILRDCRRRRRDLEYDRTSFGSYDFYGSSEQNRPMLYGRPDVPPRADARDRRASPNGRRLRSPSPRFRDPQPPLGRSRSRSPIPEGNQ